jgi:hypothetical protein
MLSDLFITNDELVELTGYKLAQKQKQILDRHGIRYVIRRDGHVRIARAWLTEFQKIPTPENDGFNLEALE